MKALIGKAIVFIAWGLLSGIAWAGFIGGTGCAAQMATPEDIAGDDSTIVVAADEDEGDVSSAGLVEDDDAAPAEPTSRGVACDEKRIDTTTSSNGRGSRHTWWYATVDGVARDEGAYFLLCGRWEDFNLPPNDNQTTQSGFDNTEGCHATWPTFRDDMAFVLCRYRGDSKEDGGKWVVGLEYGWDDVQWITP